MMRHHKMAFQILCNLAASLARPEQDPKEKNWPSRWIVPFSRPPPQNAGCRKVEARRNIQRTRASLAAGRVKSEVETPVGQADLQANKELLGKEIAVVMLIL